MTYAWNNHSTQNAHIKQMRDDRQKAYMETHRGNKAYERFVNLLQQKKSYSIIQTRAEVS